MVLLLQTISDQSKQIGHYKSFHNPSYICSPRASYNKHGWMEGLDSTSNREMDIIYLHTSHLRDMKPYGSCVPFTLSSTEYPNWKILARPNLKLIHM